MIMDVLAWVLFGAVVGWVASKIMGNSQRQGLLANIIIGIIGAFIGGYVAGLFDMPSPVAGLDLYSFLVALSGAVILLWLAKVVRG